MRFLGLVILGVRKLDCFFRLSRNGDEIGLAKAHTLYAKLNNSHAINFDPILPAGMRTDLKTKIRFQLYGLLR